MDGGYRRDGHPSFSSFCVYVFEVGMLLTHVVHTNQRDWVLRFAAGRQAVVCVPNYGVTNG